MAKGQDELLEVLRDQRSVGRIQVPGRLGWDLRYAHQVPLDDGGPRIFLATDRPIAIWEAINRPRTIDYPFTFIRLHMKGDGVGEGTLSLATRVIVDEDDDVIEFERYTANPIQLNEVRLRQ